jgi:hypothetical protein
MTSISPWGGALLPCACGGKRSGHASGKYGFCLVQVTKIEKAPERARESLSAQPKFGTKLEEGCYKLPKSIKD